jgi:hypothetical protein
VNLISKILSQPGEVLFSEFRKSLLEILFMLGCQFELVDKLPHLLESSKYDIFAGKGVLAKEDFESGSILVLVTAEVREGTGELVEIIVEQIDGAISLFLHGRFIIPLTGVDFNHTTVYSFLAKN